MNKKPDAGDIEQFVNELRNSTWIRNSERSNWPRFGFHYTDIRNAVEILRAGRLLSRHRMEAEQRLPVSSGSSEVLAFTDGEIKDYVRLYFRPKTPTQFYAEGVKSRDSRTNSRFPDAHCPVPVFLLFDLAHILSLADTRFSDKGLGSHRYHIYSTADELRHLNWQRIYHLGPVDITKPDDRETIASRNAEIIVPGELDLTGLRYIYCRSNAELESLRYLTSQACSDRYRSKMVSSARQHLYTRQHTFLETVRLTADSVVLNFSPDTMSPGPFQFTYEFKTLAGEELQKREIDGFVVRNSKGRFDFRIAAPAKEYEITIWLDAALIYANVHRELDVPL